MKWPCVFKHPIIRESVNPQLAAIDPKTPFGAFQKAFRSEHCATLNPYGSESCPYKPEDCALAYYKVARTTLETPGVRSRVAYFRKVARSFGAERADNKPLAREIIRTDVQSDAARAVGRGDDEGRVLRTSRPRSIGSLLGDDDG